MKYSSTLGCRKPTHQWAIQPGQTQNAHCCDNQKQWSAQQSAMLFHTPPRAASNGKLAGEWHKEWCSSDCEHGSQAGQGKTKVRLGVREETDSPRTDSRLLQTDGLHLAAVYLSSSRRPRNLITIARGSGFSELADATLFSAYVLFQLNTNTALFQISLVLKKKNIFPTQMWARGSNLDSGACWGRTFPNA